MLMRGGDVRLESMLGDLTCEFSLVAVFRDVKLLLLFNALKSLWLK
uniref:Uncharacterized protein n=1 Tax=Arundo donax TaxID=35708 RepID=A0A0A8XWP6_ARUDO